MPLICADRSKMTQTGLQTSRSAFRRPLIHINFGACLGILGGLPFGEFPAHAQSDETGVQGDHPVAAAGYWRYRETNWSRPSPAFLNRSPMSSSGARMRSS
jgi:hypothetical protein